MITVVIDTNALLVSIGRNSKYHWLFQMVLRSRIKVLISEGILNEYHEKIEQKTDVTVAENVLKTLLNLPNVLHIQVYFNWNFITADPDDNKFVDCAIAGNASFLITHDRHFNVLKERDFPLFKVVTIDEFEEIFAEK